MLTIHIKDAKCVRILPAHINQPDVVIEIDFGGCDFPKGKVDNVKELKMDYDLTTGKVTETRCNKNHNIHAEGINAGFFKSNILAYGKNTSFAKVKNFGFKKSVVYQPKPKNNEKSKDTL